MNLKKRLLEALAPPQGAKCGQRGPLGFWCTERPGHYGEHIAWTPNGAVCERWEEVESSAMAEGEGV